MGACRQTIALEFPGIQRKITNRSVCASVLATQLMGNLVGRLIHIKQLQQLTLGATCHLRSAWACLPVVSASLSLSEFTEQFIFCFILLSRCCVVVQELESYVAALSII